MGRPSARPESGHSLIELMFVLVIMTLIAALASPALTSRPASPSAGLAGARRGAILAGRDSIILLGPAASTLSETVRLRPDGSQVRLGGISFTAPYPEAQP